MTRADSPRPFVTMTHQVYSVVMDLVQMYEHYRVPISVEECNRLLAIARPPTAPGAAGA